VSSFGQSKFTTYCSYTPETPETLTVIFLRVTPIFCIQVSTYVSSCHTIRISFVPSKRRGTFHFLQILGRGIYQNVNLLLLTENSGSKPY
jgi:hypothetical protein